MSFSRLHDDTLQIRLAGSWRIQDGLPSVNQLQSTGGNLHHGYRECAPGELRWGP